MALSNVLISEFVKVTNDNPKSHTGATVYGTAKEYDGEMYVQLDGSDLLTPIETTTNIKDGERVTVTVKNHTATVDGNLSSPAARDEEVKDVDGKVDEVSGKVDEFEIIIADKVSTDYLEANYATIGKLEAEYATIEHLHAEYAEIDHLHAEYATIDKLEAEYATIDKLEAEYATITELNATNADIYDLNATFGDFKVLTTDKFAALDATIENLDAGTITTEHLEANYANIDFANIGEAAIETFFAKSGMIDDLTVSEGTITGTLVGVTIKGDLIEGGTIVADKLVIQGEDGLYYKLNTNGETVSTQQTEYNSLSGTIITAKSITAEKVSVDDLVAFDATIGGFNITEASIYSGVKTTVDNTTTGIYMDIEGQFAFGDATNYAKYYRDDEGNYHLEISADELLFGSDKKSVETSLDDMSTELHTEIMEQATQVAANSEEFVVKSLESYVEVGEYNDFKETVESEFSVQSEQIEMKFDSATNRVNAVDSDLQETKDEWNKRFIFTEDGLTIKAGESSMQIVIDNDIIFFKKNGESFGWWDGIDFHTGNIVVEVNERAQFGGFGFVPRSDGSLMFLKLDDSNNKYAILITTQPKACTVVVGTDATFSIEVSGDPEGYQWQTSTDGTNYTNVSEADGGTLTELTLGEVELGDDGMYVRCIITNKLGNQTTSDAVQMKVVDADTLVILTQPQDQSILLGGTAVFTVEASGVDLNYSWWRKTGTYSVYSVIDGATSNTLEITPESTSISGYKYKCKVSSGTGTSAPTIESDEVTLYVTEE